MGDVGFWEDRSVLITGDAGFKGTWLAMWLHHHGAKITGYSLGPPTMPSMFDIVKLESIVNSVRGDVCDQDLLHKTFVSAQPEIVFHLAAQPLVRASYVNPVETYRTNVLGTASLLETVRASRSANAVVVVTSDKCYENQEWAWGYRENDRLGGADPYSSSKACAELVTAAYTASYFQAETYADHCTAVATVRAGNVIGGGDWAADRLIPDLVRSIEDGSAVKLRNPSAIRPWQHVLEPLSGYLNLARKLLESGSGFAEAWNFGPTETEARSVAWLTDGFLSLWNGGGGWHDDDTVNPDETQFLKVDSSKSLQRLQWRPRWSARRALIESVNWYKAYVLGTDMHQFTLAQISQYLEETLDPESRDE